MTELGIVASVIQIADVGIRLSLKLYAFGEAVSSANRSIISISKDVSLTSSVLKELGQILDTDQNQGARLCSENAVQTANGIVTECKEVFQELDEILLKKLPHRSQGDKATRATLALERLKWPFIQPRIQLLRGHLDTLKSTLTLMLNVIMYAGQVRDRAKRSRDVSEMPEVDAQKVLIEDLAHSNNEYIQRFEKLRLAIADSASVNAPKTYIPLPAPKPWESNHKHSVEDFNLIALTDKHNMKFTHSASTDPSSVFDFLGLKLEHYQRLVDALLEEVYQPQYDIPNDSRLRIRTNILHTHVHEWRMMLIRARSASVNMQEDVTRPSTAVAADNPGTDLPFKDEELPHPHQRCLNWLFITSGSPDTFPHACSRCIDRLCLERNKSDHDDLLMADDRCRGFLQESRQQMTCEKETRRRGKLPQHADWEMAGIAPNLHQDIQQDRDRWDATHSWVIHTQPKIQFHNSQPQPQKIATAEITPDAHKDSADNNEHKASLIKRRCRAKSTEDLDQQPDARDEPFRKIESLHHCLMPPKSIDQQPDARNEPFSKSGLGYGSMRQRPTIPNELTRDALFRYQKTLLLDLASGYHPRSIESKPNKRNHEDDCELGWEAMTEMAGPNKPIDCHQQSGEEVCTSIPNAALNNQPFGPGGTRNMSSLPTSSENDVVDNLLLQWTTLTSHPFHPRKKFKS